jgi:hypothetical protein
MSTSCPASDYACACAYACAASTTGAKPLDEGCGLVSACWPGIRFMASCLTAGPLMLVGSTDLSDDVARYVFSVLVGGGPCVFTREYMPGGWGWLPVSARLESAPLTARGGLMPGRGRWPIRTRLRRPGTWLRQRDDGQCRAVPMLRAPVSGPVAVPLPESLPLRATGSCAGGPWASTSSG